MAVEPAIPLSVDGIASVVDELIADVEGAGAPAICASIEDHAVMRSAGAMSYNVLRWVSSKRHHPLC